MMIAAKYNHHCHRIVKDSSLEMSLIRVTSFGNFPAKREIPLTTKYDPTTEVNIIIM